MKELKWGTVGYHIAEISEMFKHDQLLMREPWAIKLKAKMKGQRKTRLLSREGYERLVKKINKKPLTK